MNRTIKVFKANCIIYHFNLGFCLKNMRNRNIIFSRRTDILQTELKEII